MRNVLTKLQELIRQIVYLDEDAQEFFSLHFQGVSSEMRGLQRYPVGGERAILTSWISRDLEWWREVCQDRDDFERHITLYERAYNVIECTNPCPNDVGMAESLRMLEEFLCAVRHLQRDEIEFLSSYLDDVSYDLINFYHGKNKNLPNIANLWDQFGSTSYSHFTHQLLSWMYENDNDSSVPNLCGWLLGTLPKTEEVKQILLKGIWNTQKSNQLRVRYFSCFSLDFENEAVAFFSEKLEQFIQENENNEKLIAAVFDIMFWPVMSGASLENAKIIVITYINAHPDVINHIFVSTKKCLGVV